MLSDAKKAEKARRAARWQKGVLLRRMQQVSQLLKTQVQEKEVFTPKPSHQPTFTPAQLHAQDVQYASRVVKNGKKHETIWIATFGGKTGEGITKQEAFGKLRHQL